MARTPNDYGTMGPQSTAPNPTQRNGNPPPTLPPSHAATVSPGPTGLPHSDPQANADRVRGNRPDPSNGDASGANRQAR
jgi:hypothetical protein